MRVKTFLRRFQPRRWLEREVLDIATRFYLGSRRFNGVPARSLPGHTWSDTRQCLAALLRQGRITLNFGDRHPNPHILAFPPESVDEQLEKLGGPFEQACVYPTPVHLRTVVNEREYDGRPFTLRLALGEPQLVPVQFHLSVLEPYRNDPRYIFQHNDVSGLIAVADRHSDTDEMHERDQILLETFGFAYDENLNRAVASFIWYLSELTPEHQQVWNAKVLGPGYCLHPDYRRTALIGDWQERISIFEAILLEMKTINEMSVAMGREPLFRKLPDKRPTDFSFLIRPTLKEFNDFILTLDKLLSENINLDFLNGEVAVEAVQLRPDGTHEVIRRGSIAVLSEWLLTHVQMPDPEPIKDSIALIKQVRELRQRPAHAVDENEFDQDYFHKQRQIVMRTYGAVRNLRLLFSNHPGTHGVVVNEYLVEPKIWTY